MRSSAPYEDAAAHSFAGQLESYLDVDAGSAPARIVDVWRSGFSDRIYAYRAEQGVHAPPAAPAVLVQRMVHAYAAGVAFSADPVSGRRGVAVVAAVRGYGDVLVSGEKDADSWRVTRAGDIIERTLADPSAPVLTDAQVLAVAQMARRAEFHFGRPQDIEWAIDAPAQRDLYLLQSRPITALANVPDPDAMRILWDNSNIIESYGGMTTPLTYSFARRAYTEVYQQFCRVVRVPEATIQANHAVFGSMIGLINGRIYYNLYSWYRLLALLPGFRANRTFMEQMMGVKESLPDEIVASLERSTWRQRMADRLYLARTVAGLFTAYAGLDRSIQAFYVRLRDALGDERPDLSDRRAGDLVAVLPRTGQPTAPQVGRAARQRLLRHDLLRHAALPRPEVVRRCRRRAPERPAHGRRRYDQRRTRAACAGHGCARADRRIVDAGPDRHDANRFAPGDRWRAGACRRACGLPTRTTWPPSATAVSTSSNSKARRSTTIPCRCCAPWASSPPAVRFCKPAKSTSRCERAAEEQVRTALSAKPVKRTLFNWVLKNARSRVRDRENLRFERTRVFGRARQIFSELGKRFYAVDALADPRDVYYLTVDEILGFVDGTTASADLDGLAAVRKAEFARYAQTPSPASRFETAGIVHRGNVFQAAVRRTADRARRRRHDRHRLLSRRRARARPCRCQSAGCGTGAGRHRGGRAHGPKLDHDPAPGRRATGRARQPAFPRRHRLA